MMQAVNFFSYDVYRKGLLRLTRNEKVTNVERFLGGAMAGDACSKHNCWHAVLKVVMQRICIRR